MSDLRELEQKATAAPWAQGRGETFSHWIDAAGRVIVDAQMPADAALIAALRNAAPLLLDVVDAARAFYMRGSPDGQESDRLEIALGDALAALDEALAK